MDAKKSKWILLVGYCIPYVFLCLYGDAVWGTGLIYGAAVAVLVALCLFSCKMQQIKIVVIGNVLSFAVSELCVLLFAMETFNYYFKPFSAHMLVGLCTLIVILIQAYVISRATDNTKRAKDIIKNSFEKKGKF